MELTRRKALMLGVGVTALAFMPFTPATAAVEDAIAEFTGGADAGDGDITLITPEIAENGNTVPVSVDAPGAVSIAIFAAGNPNPDVVTFNFGPLAASHSASTRMRLAGTQDVIAIAKMPDGSFIRAANQVKVTIGGCGG